MPNNELAREPMDVEAPLVAWWAVYACACHSLRHGAFAGDGGELARELLAGIRDQLGAGLIEAGYVTPDELAADASPEGPATAASVDDVVFLLSMFTDGGTILPVDEIAGWTQEQRDAAAAWALDVQAHAAQFAGRAVSPVVPQTPEHVRRVIGSDGGRDGDDDEG